MEKPVDVAVASGAPGEIGGQKGNKARQGQASSSSVNDTKTNNSGKRNLAIFEGVSEDFRIKRKTQLENFRENDKEDEIIFVIR